MRNISLLLTLLVAGAAAEVFAQSGQQRRAPIDLAVRAALDAGQHPSVIVK